jgi:hypothetical protein
MISSSLALGRSSPHMFRNNRGQVARRWMATKAKDAGSMHLVKAGLPLILFCGLGVWVVASGIEGKNKERDMFQGRISK